MAHDNTDNAQAYLQTPRSSPTVAEDATHLRGGTARQASYESCSRSQRRSAGMPRSPRLEERRGGCVGRSLLAEVSGALHEERSFSSAQGFPADGGGDHPHSLRPARCPERPPAVA